MTFIVLILVCCVVFLMWMWNKPRPLKPPSYPGSLPIIGHAHIMATADPIALWEREKAIYQSSLDNGGIVKIKLGPFEFYMLTDPDDSHYISNTCLDKPYFYRFGKEVYDRGLVSADAKIWKPHRRLLNQAFNQRALFSFVEEFCTQAKRLVSDLECKIGREPFNLQPYLDQTYLTIAYHTTLGVNHSDASESINKYGDVTRDLFAIFFRRLQKIWLHLPMLYNISDLKKKEIILSNTLKDITNGIIKERKLELKQNNQDQNKGTVKYKSFLDLMLQLAEEQDAFSDEEVREHLDTLMTATYDTVSASMTFMFILIGSYPEVQERMYKELQEVLGDQSKDLTRHDYSKLVYMEAVIKESLRLYPPTPRIARTFDSDFKLRNYIIPANSVCVISLYGINRHAMWGPDANEFKPQRWLHPATLPTNPNAFASFSLGRRNCIGQVYAMLVMKTTLAYVLQKYRITGNIHNVKSVCDLVVNPVSGHYISLELRS